MSVPSYELTRLDPNNFEHLVNALGLKVLGAGLTGFGPGADGGRDGYFEGVALYPSPAENWSGTWYLQSKFHPPHLSSDPQKWLLNQIAVELKAFKNTASKRRVPDNWIIVTNIEPSGVSETGCFDAARTLVKRFSPSLAKRFHIWGGRKILDLLADNPSVAEYYGAFLTPGNVLKALYDSLGDNQADVNGIARHLSVTQMVEQQYTKLEQAGSTVDNRPGIQNLFTDIPYRCASKAGYSARALAKTLAQVHRSGSADVTDVNWKIWSNAPERARYWFVKGGPGQGKSTLTQYIAQIQRAALILGNSEIKTTQTQRQIAEEIRTCATKQGLWPETPRIPVLIELKDLAFWFGQRSATQSRRVITYLAEKFTRDMGMPVLAGTLKRSFAGSRWLFIFDGLDEVPGDVKDSVADEVIHFVEDALISCDSDAMIVCTSRPQGYSGQFKSLASATIELSPLSPEQALRCATPLLKIDRSATDSRNFIETLKEALKSPAIAEIMTTPLQAHIMAVIVRDGGKPPERKWKLFNTFYEVIKKREATRNLPDKHLGALLRQGDKLLRALHNRLGFELHARAETSKGAMTAIPRSELQEIVTETVKFLQEKSVQQTVKTLMKATTERLVLVNTPESGEHVRFDIRPLQEFFAAEFLYRHADTEGFRERLSKIAADSHWREVMHFLISALVENGRSNELSIAINILEEIDSGSLPAARTINRRISAGANVTARLLAEGVLEEDRQVRGRFLNSMMPIAGQTNPSEILGRSLQMHSLGWLQDVLIVALKELPAQETFGAAVILSDILPDKDKRNVLVSQFIVSNGFEYVSRVLKTAWLNSKDDNPKFHRWVVKLAVDLLLSDDWIKVDEEAMVALTSIATANISALKGAVGRQVGGEVLGILPILLSLDDGRSSKNVSMEIVRLYKSIEVHLRPPHAELDFMGWSDQLWNELDKAPGIVFAIGRCFKMLKDKTSSSKDALLAAVGDRYDNLALLPYPVSSFLRDSAFCIDNSEIIAPQELIEKEHPGWYRIMMEAAGTEIPQWSEVLRNKPIMFLYLVSTYKQRNEKDETIKEFFSNSENAAAISKLVKWSARRDPLRVYQILKKLDCPTDAWIADTVLVASQNPVLRHPYRHTFQGFPLSFPEQLPFLPHILGAVLDTFEASRRFSYQTQKYERGTLSTWMLEISQNAAPLKKVWNDRKERDDVRIAALIAYLLHPKSGKVDKLESLPGLYHKDIADWMLPGIGYAFFDKLVDGNLEAMELFGALIEQSGNDVMARMSLDPLFQSWREASGAPVTSSRGTIRWT